MKTVLLESLSGSYKWIDVVQPKAEELQSLAAEYGLHPSSVEDCLEPWHLPKVERFGRSHFFILRAYDEAVLPTATASVVQQITRKLAVFVTDQAFITIHRAEMPFFTKLTDRYRSGGETLPAQPAELFLRLLEATAESYTESLDASEKLMDGYEFNVFNEDRIDLDFQQFYFFKRRLTLIRKMLRMKLDILAKLDELCAADLGTVRQDVRETIDALYFQSEELVNDSQNLMGMYLNIASHRNNEVVRVLTIFSVFFLPLTFVAGIYGMNFDIMPELRSPYGYPATIGAMVLISVGIYVWFKRNKWL